MARPIVTNLSLARLELNRRMHESRPLTQKMFRRPYRGELSALAEGCTRDTPNCDYMSQGRPRPDCCTDHLMEMAVFLDRLLRREGIVHWLDWGSLLGAVRDQALIPWDGDVDFGVLVSESQWKALRGLHAEIVEAGFHVLHHRGKRMKIVYSPTNQLGIDLYRFHLDDGLAVYGESHKRGEGRRWSFPERFIENVETVHLGAHPFPAPSPVVPFLVEHRFGPTYMIPFNPIKGVPYPDIDDEGRSPAIQHLLRQLFDSQQRLLEAKRRLRPTRSRFRVRHGDPGLPAVPLRRFVERALKPIPEHQRTPLVHELSFLVAALDQATAEIVDPDLALWLHRVARTNANLRSGLRQSTRTRSRALRRGTRRVRRSVRKLASAVLLP